jgi:hypothetical protein
LLGGEEGIYREIVHITANEHLFRELLERRLYNTNNWIFFFREAKKEARSVKRGAEEIE